MNNYYQAHSELGMVLLLFIVGGVWFCYYLQQVGCGFVTRWGVLLLLFITGGVWLLLFLAVGFVSITIYSRWVQFCYYL